MEKKKIDKDKKLLTMVILFFPTIIIVALSSIQEVLIRAILMVLVGIYQMIILKNLLDEYYGD